MAGEPTTPTTAMEPRPMPRYCLSTHGWLVNLDLIVAFVPITDAQGACVAYSPLAPDRNTQIDAVDAGALTVALGLDPATRAAARTAGAR